MKRWPPTEAEVIAVLVAAMEHALRQADKNMKKNFGGKRSPATQASYDKCVAALEFARARKAEAAS